MWARDQNVGAADTLRVRDVRTKLHAVVAYKFMGS